MGRQQRSCHPKHAQWRMGTLYGTELSTYRRTCLVSMRRVLCSAVLCSAVLCSALFLARQVVALRVMMHWLGRSEVRGSRGGSLKVQGALSLLAATAGLTKLRPLHPPP